MTIDPRLLRFLRAIDEHGTFTRAASVEGVSQPALTAKIGLLERQLGTRLIDRGRQGAKLNSYGKLLLRHARMIDTTLEWAAREVDLAKSGERGPLVVGVTPISLIELLPKALDKLDRAGTSAHITIKEADDDAAIDMLEAGEIDLMLGGVVAGRSAENIKQIHLADFPLHLVVGRESPLWGSDGVFLEEVIDQPWTLPASGSVIRSYVDAIFVGAGQDLPTSYWSCSGMAALKAVVSHTRRITVMPEHAIQLEAELGVLQAVTLRSPNSHRRMHILHLDHDFLSPIAQELIENLHEVAETMRAS